MDENVEDFQLEGQDKFWLEIIKKYELQNDSLENEKEIIQECVNQMESWMPAYVAYSMAKLQRTNPEVNINSLLSLPCQCTINQIIEEKKIPDLSNMSVFSMQDNDVHYMDIIKDLENQESALMNSINRLRYKDKCLKDTKKKVDMMLSGIDDNKTTTINAWPLENFKNRLTKENDVLKGELDDLKEKLKEVRDKTSETFKELEKERLKGIKLKHTLDHPQERGGCCCDGPQKRIGSLKEQLKELTEKVYEQSDLHEKLKNELSMIWAKTDEVKEDIINNKILEFEEKKQRA